MQHNQLLHLVPHNVQCFNSGKKASQINFCSSLTADNKIAICPDSQAECHLCLCRQQEANQKRRMRHSRLNTETENISTNCSFNYQKLAHQLLPHHPHLFVQLFSFLSLLLCNNTSFDQSSCPVLIQRVLQHIHPSHTHNQHKHPCSAQLLCCCHEILCSRLLFPFQQDLHHPPRLPHPFLVSLSFYLGESPVCFQLSAVELCGRALNDVTKCQNGRLCCFCVAW